MSEDYWARKTKTCGDDACPKVHVRAMTAGALGVFHSLADGREFITTGMGSTWGTLEVLRARENTVMMTIKVGGGIARLGKKRKVRA